MYDACRATGGYYREGYGGGGLLDVMGMSWHEIMNGLEDKEMLPPAHARHLLAELESRPITRAMLEEERRPGPLADWLRRMVRDVAGGEVTPLRFVSAAGSDDDGALKAEGPDDRKIERTYRQYAKRREELMALLRKAIERDETLRISG